MSALGLKSEYTVKYGLFPPNFPWTLPSGNPLGSGHILLYIPPLVLIGIQYYKSLRINVYNFFLK